MCYRLARHRHKHHAAGETHTPPPLHAGATAGNPRTASHLSVSFVARRNLGVVGSLDLGLQLRSSLVDGRFSLPVRIGCLESIARSGYLSSDTCLVVFATLPGHRYMTAIKGAHELVEPSDTILDTRSQISTQVVALSVDVQVLDHFKLASAPIGARLCRCAVDVTWVRPA